MINRTVAQSRRHVVRLDEQGALESMMKDQKGWWAR
jgi:hypothetical protein